MSDDDNKQKMLRENTQKMLTLQMLKATLSCLSVACIALSKHFVCRIVNF